MNEDEDLKAFILACHGEELDEIWKVQKIKFTFLLLCPLRMFMFTICRLPATGKCSSCGPWSSLDLKSSGRSIDGLWSSMFIIIMIELLWLCLCSCQIVCLPSWRCTWWASKFLYKFSTSRILTWSSLYLFRSTDYSSGCLFSHCDFLGSVKTRILAVDLSSAIFKMYQWPLSSE